RAKVVLRGTKPGQPRGFVIQMDGMSGRAAMAGEQVQSGETDPTGHYEVLGLDATCRYSIEVAPPAEFLEAEAAAPALRSGEVVREAQETTGVELRLGEGLKLAVAVRDAGRHPLAGARVSAGHQFRKAKEARTDSAGEAVVLGLESSEVQVEIELEGYVRL